MPITATNNGTVREPIPAGNYIARCYQMIELGTITEFVINKTVTLKKVRIGWELPTELKVFDPAKGEQPLAISKEYTLSMHEKSNLRKDLKSWRGRDFTEDEAKAFDITKLIGAPCMLNIIHKNSATDPTRVYDQIAGITAMPKGVKAPEAMNKPFVLSYDDFDEDKFKILPDFIKVKMQGSSEFQALRNPAERTFVNANDITEPIEDLPF